jgi:hypothetical protein
VGQLLAHRPTTTMLEPLCQRNCGMTLLAMSSISAVILGMSPEFNPRTIEFIPIKPSVAMALNARESYARHSRLP